MTIHNVDWDNKDQIIEEKMDNMVSDANNTGDDIHPQYLADLNAPNTSTSYIRSDEAGDTIDIDYTTDVANQLAYNTTTVNLTWENGAFDGTDYNIGLALEVVSSSAVNGTYLCTVAAEVTSITASGCTVKVIAFGYSDGSSIVDISVEFIVHAIAMKRGT